MIFQGYDGQTMIDPRFDEVKIVVLKGASMRGYALKRRGPCEEAVCMQQYSDQWNTTHPFGRNKMIFGSKCLH